MEKERLSKKRVGAAALGAAAPGADDAAGAGPVGVVGAGLRPLGDFELRETTRIPSGNQENPHVNGGF